MYGDDHVYDFDPLLTYANLPYDLFRQIKISDFTFDGIFLLDSPILTIPENVILKSLRKLRDHMVVCFTQGCDRSLAISSGAIPSISGINQYIFD